MASKKNTSIVLFLVLNLFFFTLSSAISNPSNGSCPVDTLQLGVCANLLGSLLGITIGTPPKTPCCSLIKGLVDVEAAACLCTAIKADVLGIIKVDVPLSLRLLLNVCSKKVPQGFTCA